MVKYKCDHPGATKGKSGKFYQWKGGEEFLAVEGDVDHVRGMSKVAMKKKRTKKKSKKKSSKK